jgi:hypothetical protein
MSRFKPFPSDEGKGFFMGARYWLLTLWCHAFAKAKKGVNK